VVRLAAEAGRAMEISSLFNLSGCVALVVGASRGIGRAIAQGLADAGASVALCSRTQADLLLAAEEIRALGTRAEVFAADVSIVAEIQALVRDVLARMGYRLDLFRYIPTARSCRLCNVKFVSLGPPAAVSNLTLTDSIDHQISKATALFLSK